MNKPLQRYKWQLWTAVIIITILCWLEFWYFSAPTDQVRALTDGKRRAAHFICLIAVAVVGYWGYFRHPVKVLKTIWLYFYVFAIVFLLATALLHAKFGLFPKEFMDWLSDMRSFVLNTPMPFLVIYILGLNIKAK
jgi:hypothetical protein